MSLTFRMALIAGLSLISACANLIGPPSLETQAERLSETLQQGGYRSATRLAISSSQQRWQEAGTELQISITAPTTAGAYPLIIYLPGLGEDAEAGRLWRESWATAGYMVLTVQATEMANALQALQAQALDDDDPLLKRPRDQDDIDRMLPAAEDARGARQRRSVSDIARNSELRYLGHTYFSPENVRQRLNHLASAFARFKRLAQTGQAPFAQADLSRIIVAGYELGAQTASALAGERYDIALPGDDGLKPLAYLQLSPVVDLAGGNLRNRFQNMHQPMLVITSHQDDDPYAIGSASARTSIWEYAPAEMKYLLLLKDAGHRMLAGSELGDRSRQGTGTREVGDFFDPFSSRNSAGSRQRPHPMMAIDDDDRRHAERQREVLGYKQVAAILSVSTAFFDLLSKQDPSARLWLRDNANSWLGTAGVLKYK